MRLGKMFPALMVLVGAAVFFSGCTVPDVTGMFAPTAASVSTGAAPNMNRPTPVPFKRTPTKSPTPTRRPATATPDLAATQAAVDGTSTAVALHATATTQACLHPTTAITSDWSAVLCDTFDTNRNGWDIRKRDNSALLGTFDVIDSKYRWTMQARRSLVLPVEPKMKAVTDFYLTTEVKRARSDSPAQYGVMFRNDGVSCYLFQISDDGVFGIWLSDRGQWDTLVDWTRTDTIHPFEVNRLTVIGEDSHFTFYLNDALVHELDDATLGKGTVGVSAGLNNEGDTAALEFDNFEVRVPPPGWVRPTAAPTLVPPTVKATVLPTREPTLPPPQASTALPQSSACNLDAGNAGILVVNHFDGLMTFTMLNHEYKLDGHTEQLVQMPGGQEFTVSVSVVGVGKTNFGPLSLNAGECVRYEPDAE